MILCTIDFGNDIVTCSNSVNYWWMNNLAHLIACGHSFNHSGIVLVLSNCQIPGAYFYDLLNQYYECLYFENWEFLIEQNNCPLWLSKISYFTMFGAGKWCRHNL